MANPAPEAHFGQQLKTLIIRPWQAHYLDYAHLKRILRLFLLPADGDEFPRAYEALRQACLEHQGIPAEIREAVAQIPIVEASADEPGFLRHRLGSPTADSKEQQPSQPPPPPSAAASVAIPIISPRKARKASPAPTSSPPPPLPVSSLSNVSKSPDNQLQDSAAVLSSPSAADAAASDRRLAIYQMFLACLEDNVDRTQIFFSSRLSFYAGLMREMEIQFYTSDEANSKIKERAELLARISSSLQRLQHDLNMLGSFAEVNAVACRRILAKLDQYSGSDLQQPLFSWIAERRTFCDPVELEQLAGEARRFAIEVNRLLVTS